MRQTTTTTMRLFLPFLLSLAVWPRPAASQVDQGTLVQELSSPDLDRRAAIVWTIRDLPADQWGDELESALITALDRSNRQARADRAAGRPSNRAEVETRLLLATLVSRIEDRRAIPALAGALGTGAPAVQGLAALGPETVPPILDVLGTDDLGRSAFNDGLRALTGIMERAAADGLAPDVLEGVRAIASRGLSTEAVTGTTVKWALNLAAHVADDALISRMGSIAADPAVLADIGITDPGVVSDLRRLAERRIRDATTRRIR